MKIHIQGVDERFSYDYEHIIKLFYEEPEINFIHHEFDTEQIHTAVDRAEQTISFQISESVNSIHVTASLRDQKGETLQESVVRPADQLKKAMNMALLRILTSYTGIDQPWGILTGVRPTKLVHRGREEGKPYQEIRQELEQNYLIAPDKIQVMEAIVEKQLVVIPDLYQLDREISIYIGIPFCPTKCAYCTFPAYSIQGKQGSVDSFLAGLHTEIEQVGKWLTANQMGITSIYFGGGTPTSIEANELDELFQTIDRAFPNQGKCRELTVEAGRPDTITTEKIDVLKKWRVDRISINPQSFTQATLDAIGRHHTVDEVLEKYELARSMGLRNINMDLIIGLPGEGMEQYLHSLRMIESLRPESLTVHTLSFKTASTMTKNRDRYKVADRDEVARMISATEQWTQEMGYAPYYLYRQKNILGNQENVGYALPGKESIYNIIIMEEKQTILGLGCGASSKIISPLTKKITRYANPKEPKVYNERYQDYISGKLALLESEYIGK